MSLDLLGADPAPRGIFVRILNAGALAAKEGGATGAIAAALVPETIEGVVLDKIVSQLRSSLREKGVEAEVSVAAAAGAQPASSGTDVAGLLGAGLAGAALALAAQWLMPRLGR